jgi:branched-chain amino acid transport system ATP-binding protein
MSVDLELQNLCAWYGQTRALNSINVVVERGSVTTLLGANGAGKTTTLRAICGMTRTSGKVLFRGSDISRMPTHRIAANGIAHVPDGRGTIAELTVEENLRLAAGVLGGRRKLWSNLDRMYEYFPRLKERRQQQAGTLSGGEQQMLAFSRALMIEPKILLLDEPSFGLAPMIVDQIFKIISTIRLQQSISILLVEQNAHRALEISTYAYLIDAGKLVTSGPAKSLASDETIRKTYLGY